MSGSPSRESGARLLPDAPPCPFCRGGETELMNAFGSHASVSTYWCRPCGSPFEIFKWRSGDRSRDEGPAEAEPGETGGRG